MPNELLIVSSTFLAVVLLLLVMLFLNLRQSQKLVTKLASQNNQTLQALLREQRLENQSLRNQLRSPDVPTLLGLNNATLPVDATASNENGDTVIDASSLSEAIAYEEALAKQGYTINDLGDDLGAHGWNNAVTRRDGDAIAFE